MVAGCGYAGKRHIDHILKHRGCTLAALVDTNEKACSQLSEGDLPCFTSLNECLQSGIDSDVVVIATPNGTHAALALEALNNKKHVLIEKPMALHAADASALLRKAEEAKRKVMVVLQNRFSPISQWLKQVMDSAILGQIFYVEVNCFWNRDERYYTHGSWHGTKELDGGVLFTQFSHFIDTLYWLFGNIKNISSRFYNFRHQHLTAFEDTGIVHFDFEKGGAGCFNFSTAAWERNLESSVTILAENGSLKISGQYMDVVEYCYIKNYEVPPLPSANAAANGQKMLQSLIDAIENGDELNAVEATNTIDIIERMYAADEENRMETHMMTQIITAK